MNEALIYHDYMATFPDEVKCIWQRKFTGATVLFSINRYAALLYLAFSIITSLPEWQTEKEKIANLVGSSLVYIIQYTANIPSGVGIPASCSVHYGS